EGSPGIRGPGQEHFGPIEVRTQDAGNPSAEHCVQVIPSRFTSKAKSAGRAVQVVQGQSCDASDSVSQRVSMPGGNHGTQDVPCFQEASLLAEVETLVLCGGEDWESGLPVRECARFFAGGVRQGAVNKRDRPYGHGNPAGVFCCQEPADLIGWFG